MSRPPKLAARRLAPARAFNAAVQAFDGQCLGAEGSGHYLRAGSGPDIPGRFALLVECGFGGHGFQLGFARLPFAQRLQELVQPWTLDEIDAGLAQAVIAHLAGEAAGAALGGGELAFKGSFPGAAAAQPRRGPFHLHFEIREGGSDLCVQRADFFSEEDFPFADLAACLARAGILAGAGRRRWPPRLCLNFALGLGHALLPAAEAQNLAAGDVIFIAPQAGA